MCENNFFHVFRDTLYKVCILCENRVFLLFLVTLCSAKSVRKQCFLTFFETLCTKFAKNSIKQRYFELLARRFRKVWENSVFFLSRFSRYSFVQSLQKMIGKTEFIELFAGRSAKNVRNYSVFSRFLRHSVQSSQNMRKTAFFVRAFRLHDVRRISVWKQCFFTFFETLCTKFAILCENIVFCYF